MSSLISGHLDVCSVIAAVKSEQAAEELSTPYKRILLNQIQQRLANSDGSQPTNGHEGGEGLNLSMDTMTGHRKKGRPAKYVSDELFTCTKCNKRFEHKSLFDQHCCFKITHGVENAERQFEGTTVAKPVEKDVNLPSAMIVDEKDSGEDSKDSSLPDSPQLSVNEVSMNGMYLSSTKPIKFSLPLLLFPSFSSPPSLPLLLFPSFPFPSLPPSISLYRVLINRLCFV